MISIRGARQHNLKNIDLDLPKNKLIVITGLSGSGKSTLAFDTLYAEGQRRYVESLSTYARQFLERMEKPDVETIDGLSPAIAIEQKTASHNPRSTVGTVTEIYDYLRLLYARVGTPHCYHCGKPISSQTVDQMVDQILSLPESTKIIILSPLITGQKGSHEKLFVRLRKDGFARVRVNQEIISLDDIKSLPKNKKHTIDVVIDRLVIRPDIKNRLADSIELALAQSQGLVAIYILDGKTILFSETAACVSCGISYPEFTPASFSFNSPQGACSRCDGLGSHMEFDPVLIVPNKSLSLRDGAIALWANRASVFYYEFLDAMTKHYAVDANTPFEDLPEPFKAVLFYGSAGEMITFFGERKGRRFTYKKPFEGIIPGLERRYRETQSNLSREDIQQYMTFKPCPKCKGLRLKKEILSVKIGEKNISQCTAHSVQQAQEFFNQLSLPPKKHIIAEKILKEIQERLSFLSNVGLNYLTLDRSATTLSGGESQRIRLATQIGSKLTGVMYVLDEPSIGLHQRDNQRLLTTLAQMRNLGNTVIVVEHDADTILSADHVVDMGPAAGVNGGKVVFNGEPKQLLKSSDSLTGQYLSGLKSIFVPEKRRKRTDKILTIEGASQNNLKSIDVAFPLSQFICVTGVSGSGKSTLVLETLYKALCQYLHHTRIQAGAHNRILGLRHIDKVIHIDQSPIGRTPRSNPGTYTGLFTYVRDLFARTPDARARGYSPGRFSFNVKGGRCEACSGDGIIRIEMHFLPDVFVTCDVCKGNRYNRETLEIKYKGKSIADVLNMTINQCLAFFENIVKIKNKLQTLVDVGLGYIKLGQSAVTLSGGEAQRVKLSRELSKRGTGRTMYILDEPTTGLHFEDIQKLLNVLNRLVDNGNTIVVIEHNLDVIKSADHVIDLGPEGGDNGGMVIGQGTPEDLTRINESYTGQYLLKVLNGH
ncbi:excinuclease ABC subunit A [Candidatus Magnetomorum sp. HK-1]|nr:excinuclease ABC subunit A [Candidatus Magnetomorum sp. HK-1]